VHKDLAASLVTDEETKSPIVISAEINNKLSSEYFGMVEFTIENTSDKWIEIEKFDVGVDDENVKDTMLFTLGKDFQIWSSAIIKRNKVEDYNQSLAYGAIILGSSLVASRSNSDSTANAAAGVAGIATLSLGVESINDARAKIESGVAFPEGNLLSKNLRIPPGLFINAWLLINTTDHDINPPIMSLNLVANYKSGYKETFRIPLYRSYSDLGRYKWQSISQRNYKEEVRKIRLSARSRANKSN